MTITEIKNKILPLLRKYGVSRASLFGSVVRGDDSPDSDIDLLVELPDDSSLLELGGLKVELEELLNRKVDLLTYNSLHHLIKEEVLSQQASLI